MGFAWKWKHFPGCKKLVKPYISQSFIKFLMVLGLKLIGAVFFGLQFSHYKPGTSIHRNSMVVQVYLHGWMWMILVEKKNERIGWSVKGWQSSHVWIGIVLSVHLSFPPSMSKRWNFKTAKFECSTVEFWWTKNYWSQLIGGLVSLLVPCRSVNWFSI